MALYEATNNIFQGEGTSVRGCLVDKPAYVSKGDANMTGYEGWQFDQYFLDLLIGRGGFADVYRAWDTNLNRWVAIKTPQKGLTAKALQKFFKEARIIARLNHPYIITVLESNRYRRIPYFVMSYAPNGSLAERHPHGEMLNMDLILEYMEQIVDALEYIHSNRPGKPCLIHQDIKPANILLGIDNKILICDFGIARFVQNTRSYIISAPDEDWAGTVIYMAPERFEGLASPATDQYALGIMLFEWLTGEYPFYGTKSEIIHQQIHTPPPSLRAIAPDISTAVEQVVLKALSKDPGARFKSVRDLFLALDEARHPSFPHSLLAFLRGSY